jgi:fimbrial isopeptide formation D2 family protein/uncharacterized repeat protein (TIGR01451 family)
MTALPHFAMLEERVLLAAQPVVTLGGDPTPLIGEQAQLTITFDNQPDGSPGSDVGYAPYVDLVLPQNGADGAGVGSTPPNENDGVTFVAASYLGQALPSTVLEFDANGQAVHPFAKDASGNLRVVNAADYGAAAGDQLVVLRLPYGSFVPDQPVAEIQVTVQVSNLADVGTPLPVSVVGGFAFGRDAPDNPTADPPVLGPIDSTTITPQLLVLDKTYNGPEGETATGPNFPRSFTVSLDIATGQVLTNASFTDLLPDGIVLVGAPVLAGVPGTATYDPLTHTVTADIAGTVTGVAGVDATLTINFYVGEFLAPGDPATPVLDPQTGAPRTLANNVSAEADWTPIDTRDPPQTIIVDQPGPEAEFVARSIATQKSQAVLIDANASGLGPGDTLRYTIDVQISDYFEFQDLELTDRLSDGQVYVGGSATLQVLEGGSSLGSGGFAAPNIVVLRDPVTGVTVFRFLVSDQLVANGAADGLLTGGEVAGSATTLRITYDARVESTFLSDGSPVDQGDTLSNSVDVGAEVLDGGIATGNRPGDTTSSGSSIATGQIAKEIYAVNGTFVTPGAAVEIGAGDLVTFRITYDLPQSLADNLILTDYLPLPIFTVGGLATTIVGAGSATPPAVNVLQWGPDAAGFLAVLSGAPLVTINAANNSFSVQFLDLHPATGLATRADLLFTVQVIDAPFGDGLQLTNQAQGIERDSDGDVVAESTAIRQLTLTEPELRITKGIVATDDASGSFSPGAIGPVGFSAPGSAGVRFSGVIDSTSLAATPVDSNLNGIDAGDLVTFAIIVENRGAGINGAFDIRIDDEVPSGFVIPPGGANLQVTDGAGNALPYILFPAAGSASIILIDPPGTGKGALAAFSPTGGANIVVITYDLRVADLVEAQQLVSNLAEIENYAAVEGGVDRVPTTTEQTSDTAAVTIVAPTIDKTIVATSLTETGSAADNPAFPDLNVGETITFDVTVTLHEGRIRNFVIEDQLPVSPGRLDYVSASLVSIGGNIVAVDANGVPTGPLGAPAITTVGNSVFFSFADDILNQADNILSDADRIVVRVTAIAANVPGNAPGTDLVNTAIVEFTANGQQIQISDTATAEMVGPAFELNKIANVAVVQGNDIVTYTVTLSPLPSNTAGPVFDLVLTDPLLPGFLDLVAGTATLVTAPAGGATVSEVNGVITVSAPVVLPGETIVITYQARVEPTVVAGTTLPNTVTADADSHPGTNPLGVERSYTASATETVRVPGPGVAKTVVEADTSLAETGSDRYDASRPDLAIGEEVTYRIVVVLPEAITQIVTFADYLPVAGGGAVTDGVFEFIGAAVVRVGSNIQGFVSGNASILDRDGDGILDSIVLPVGTLFNNPDGVFNADDEIEFSVTARVRDAAANRAGNAPVNTATVTFDAGGVITTVTDTAQVDIVEPTLSVNKLASASTGDGGDRVRYTVEARVPGFQDGPAYDIALADVIPVGMEIDVATLAFVGTAPVGATLSYDAATRTITMVVPVLTYEGGAVSFTYDAIVANSVRPDQQLVNTASAVFDSHPGDPGDVYQRDYGPVQDSETFTVLRPVLAKAISGTDIDATQFLQLTPSIADVAIGETVTYLVAFIVPEVTTSLVLTDFLPAVLGANASDGDMEWISSRIVSIGENLRFVPVPGLGGPRVGDVGTVTDSNGDGILDTIVWDLGLVTNLADNQVSQRDVIVFEVQGRVVDRASNAAGDQLTNDARLDYTRADNSTGSLTAAATVEIVAPELLIDKAADITSGDAGDIVTYTITISHDAIASTANAYELVLTDTLAPGLQLIAGSVTASLTNSAGTAIVRVGNTAGDTRVEVALDQLTERAIGPDGVLTITYQARLTDAVRHADALTNTADLVWQSAPAGFTEARADAGSDTATISAVLTPAFDKAVAETSLPETASGFFDPALPDLAIGETVTYELRVTLGEGTQQVVVQDTLPAGLVFVSGTVVSIGAGISNAALAVGAAPSVAGGIVTFDFGNAVVNTGDNQRDAGDVIVLRVTARVATLVNSAGDILTNDASLSTDSGTLNDDVSVEVVAPDVTIAKTASIASGDAGDLVTFTVVVEQVAGASAPLYDLSVEDILPAGYVLVAGSATATRGTVTELSGTTVRVTLDGAALLPTDDPATTGVDESRITITYSARLADGVQPGQVVTNTVGFTGASAPGGGVTVQTYGGQDSAQVSVAMPVALDKQIVATSLAESGTDQLDPALTDLAVGETLIYHLTATLSEGTQTLVIADTLPAELEVLTATVFGIGGGVSAGPPVISISGQAVTFDFGTVVNTGNNDLADGTVTVEIVARVRDVPGNVAGTTLTNAGAVTIASPDDPLAPGGTQQATDSTTAEVVEPELVIDKTAPPGFVVAGETILYTVTLAHQPGSTAAAYDIVLEDLLSDPYLDLVAGSVTTSAGTVVIGNGPGDAVVRIEVPVLALGQVLTVTFTARVAADAPGGVTISNTVTDTFDSSGGTGGRPDAGTDSTQTPGAPALVKEIVATSNPDTGSGAFDPTLPDVEIGETLTYRLTVTLPQGTTENLVLSDLLPPALQPLAARVVAVGSGLTAATPGITIAGQAVTLVFGTVVNGSDAAIGAEDRIIIEIDALVLDDAGISAGDRLVNDAAATFTIGGRDGTLEVEAPAELVEPVLDIAKQVDATAGDAGDLFAYTVTIGHAANSTAAAYDVVVIDTLDARFIPVDVTSTFGTATITGNEIRLEVPRFLATDAPITLTYRVRFADTVEQGQVIGNTASLGWDSNPGTGGRPDADQASAQDLTVVFNPTLTKEIVATSLPETGSDRFDPTLPDLEVGEVVTYDLVVTLSEGTQNLVITDRVPSGLLSAPFAAFVVSTGAGISAAPGGTLTPSAVFAGNPIIGQTITFDFGTIVNTGDNVTDAGDQIVIRISAIVLDLPFNVNGRQVVNTAQAVDSSPSNPGAPGGTIILDASAAAEIVVPRFLLDKTVDNVTGDAGDVFTYTLTVAPAAGTDAPAYDLLIEDALSPFLVVVPGSLTSSAGTASILGNMIRVEVPVMLPDAAPIIITYRAVFADAIEPGQIVPNTATLDYASAPNLAARNLADDAQASVRAEFVLGLTKDIVATSLPETGTSFFAPALLDVTAGETVTFHLTATLSEGTQRLVITDTLPPGLIAEAARVVSLGAGIAAAAPTITIQDGRVVFDFGTIVNTGDNIAGDQVVLEIVARLNPEPPAGTVLTNSASAQVSAPTDPSAPGGTLTAAAAASAEAVAAVLVVDKQVAPATVGLGEPITYTVTLSHAANSTAPAYEVVLQDPLSDASLQLIAGSVTTSFGTVEIGNGAGDATVRIAVPVLLPGQVLVVTFQARAIGIPIPDGIAPNTASFASTSAPGAVPPGFLRPDGGQDSAQVQIVSGTPPPDGGALLAEYDEVFRRIARNGIPAPTVLSGTAQPGAAVTLGLINAFGEQITIVGVMADAGGNWIANPIASGPGPRPEGQQDTALATLAGRQAAPDAAPALPRAETPARVTANTAPFTVVAGEAPAAFDTRVGMERLHLTFGGTVQSGGVFVGAPSSQGVVAAAALASTQVLPPTAPASLAWNRFALDFAAATAVASVVGR